MPSSLAESDGVAWPSGPSSPGPVISPAPHEDRRPPGSAARADLPGLAEQVMNEVDIGEIIRESSSTMATETVDTLRVQGMRADRLLSRTVDRVLGAAKSDRPALVSSAALKVHATVTGRYGTRHFAGCTPSGRTHLHQMKPIGPPGASIEPDERRRREGINPTVYG